MTIATGDPTAQPPTTPGKAAGNNALGVINLTPFAATVPEPATYAMGMMGLGLAWLIRRRQA